MATEDSNTATAAIIHMTDEHSILAIRLFRSGLSISALRDSTDG
jgi:hypothetical protein